MLDCVWIADSEDDVMLMELLVVEPKLKPRVYGKVYVGRWSC